ncbi:hypothetical protein [Teredinibacter turnerae]|uniref:hypothetical protein n=1 Tax=Teredinibacter turnerae TaxID=2426 RepID=UPI00048F69A7|nr:hypothetical protein [Teredinibacter turnerae]
MKKVLFVTLMVTSCISHAYNQQTAKILELYVHEEGSFAIKLQGGFLESVKQECPSNNGYAGSRIADPYLKSFLLAQFAAAREVKIGFSGCDGGWIRILDVRGFGN